MTTMLHQDIIEDKDARKFLRRHFVPFLQYLEVTDEGLKNHTSYMRKMQKHLFRILKVGKQRCQAA